MDFKKNFTSAVLREGFSHAHKIFPEGGLCLEFGVGSGRSYTWQAKQILSKYQTSRLVGFDCWQGIPKEVEGLWLPDKMKEGCCCFSRSVVESRMKFHGVDVKDPRFSFVDGLFSESLTEELQASLDNLIFVNIDVDTYKSTVQVLNFIRPLLRKDVVIYFDDMKEPTDERYTLGKWGEYLGWDQFLEANVNIKTKLVMIEDRQWRFYKILNI